MACVKKNGRYYVCFRENGKLIWLALGTSDEDTARLREQLVMKERKDARDYLRAQRALGIQPPVIMQRALSIQPALPLPVAREEPVQQSVIPSKRLRLEDMFELAKKRRPQLNIQHAEFLTRLHEWSGVEYADEITPKMAQDFLDDMYGDKKAKSFNNVKGRLNILFKTVLIDAGMQQSPFSNILPRQLNDVEHHRAFTLEESFRIIDAALPYWKVLCMLALYTGQRLETCKRIAPSFIKDGIITILPGKTSAFGRSVQIPVMKELAEFLDTIEIDRKTPEKPYCDYYKKVWKWPKSKTDQYFQALLRHLGINDENGEKASFHSFRSTFITILSEHGVNTRVIQGIVGHTDDKVTKVYNHDVKSAVDAMNAMPSLRAENKGKNK